MKVASQHEIAIVTGAGSGIGRETAMRLAVRGHSVGLVDIDFESVEKLQDHLVGEGSRAIAIDADVSDLDRVAAAVSDVVERLGPPSLLVNNAFSCRSDGLLDAETADWDRDIAVVFGGTSNFTREVIPHMINQHRGAVVNVASVNALQAYGNDSYSAAKAAVLSLTRSMAVRHGADGIRFNAVVPATIRTPGWSARLATTPDLFDELVRHYPLGRIGESADVAAAICFLLSDEASWITGTSLVVDGGLLAGNADLMGESALRRS